MHYAAQTVDVLDWFFNLQPDLLDFISKLLKERLCLLVEIFGENFLPLLNSSAKSFFDVLGLKTQGSDLVEVLNFVYFFLVLYELFNLVLKIFKLRVCGVEFLKTFIDSLPP